MTNEEKARELASKQYYNQRILPELIDSCEEACLKMAKWKEEQFEKIGYTKEKLLEMGFGFTLNGDIITPKEDEEMTKEYIAYLKQQMIKKACKWLRKTQSQSVLPDATIERFKQAMKE